MLLGLAALVWVKICFSKIQNFSDLSEEKNAEILIKFLHKRCLPSWGIRMLLECYSAAHCGMQLDDKEIQYRSSHAMHFESK